MYTLRKDGLFLLSSQPSGHKEIIADGSYSDVPVCLWGERRCGVKVFENKETAEHIAKIVGADVVKIEERKD